MVGGYSLVPKTPQVGPGPRGSLPLHSFLLVCHGPRRECFSVQAPEDGLGANAGLGDSPFFLEQRVECLDDSRWPNSMEHFLAFYNHLQSSSLTSLAVDVGRRWSSATTKSKNNKMN